MRQSLPSSSLNRLINALSLDPLSRTLDRLTLTVSRPFVGEKRWPAALLVGALVGMLGAGLALILVLEGPIIAFGLVIGLAVGLYMLTGIEAALGVLVFTAALLPFGTLPFEVGSFTPTLIETAIGGFLVVYLFQWMTGRRHEFHLTPVSWTIVVFLLVMIFAFVLGIGNGGFGLSAVANFVGLLLCVSMALVLVDVAADTRTLRRLALILLLAATLSALIGAALWFAPEDLAERTLVRLARVGYPNGGVLHFREDGVQVLNERAIGTWIAPNTFGGFLMMVGALAGTQLLSPAPLMRPRLLGWACFGAIALALFLSDSRGSFLGLVAALGVICLLRYRQLIPYFVVAGLLALLLPPVQEYLMRLYAGFTASDLETQMRLGEYQDALTLINRYPAFGVGFTGVPEIDLYVAVSSTYLTLAARAGLFGLAAYVLTMGAILGWGVRWWPHIRHESALADIWLGLLGGIVAALVGGIFDHFYFNVDFQPTAFMLWSFIGLFLAATRIVWERKMRHPVATPHPPTVPPE